MKKVSLLGFLSISLLLLGACGNSKGKTEVSKGEATVRTETVETSESSVAEETNKGEDGIVAIGEYTSDWSEDWNGLNFKIDKVAVAEMTDEEIAMKGIDNNYVVMVNYIITNNGDKDFNTYPDQGTIVIEGQQVDAEIFGSDNIGGEILQGVTKEGAVIYSVKNIEDVAAVKDIRLKWSASYDTENWDEDYYKDFDVTFDLTK